MTNFIQAYDNNDEMRSFVLIGIVNYERNLVVYS